MEKEIAVGFSILDFIDTSREVYNCQVSSGIGIKKTGTIKFKNLPKGEIRVYVKKLSGNGSFKLNGKDHVSVTSDSSYYTFTNDTSESLVISRCSASIGSISVIRISQIIPDDVYNYKNLVNILKKCECKGISLLEKECVVSAQQKASIKFSGHLESLETIPESCYRIIDNVIEFPITCTLSQIVISEIGNVNIMKSQLIQPTANNTSVAYYSAKASKFNNVIKKKGVFQFLNNKNDKMILLFAGSEIHVPVINSTYLEVSVISKNVSRTTSNISVGVSCSTIQMETVQSISKVVSHKVCFNLAGQNISNGFVIVSCSNLDSITIYDIIMRECSEEEYLLYKTSTIKPAPITKPAPIIHYQDVDVSLNCKYKVSLVMSLKNRTNFLNYSLETLKRQTLPKDQWELVVVDDGSTEDMEKFLSSYSKDINIKYLRIDSAKSSIPIWSHTPALSNNVGFKKAEGEVILICGPEILHKETNLEIAYKAAMTNIAAFGLVYHSNLKFVNYLFNGVDPKQLSFDQYMATPGAKHNCITGNSYYWYLLAVKKSNIMKINGVDEEYGRGVCGEDDNFASRLHVSGTHNKHVFDMIGIHMEHESGDDKYDIRRRRKTIEWQNARQLNTNRVHAWQQKKEPLANQDQDWGSNKVIDVHKVMSEGLIYDNKNYDVTTNYKLNDVRVLYLPIGSQPGMESAFRKFGVNLKVFNFWDKLIVERQTVVNINNQLISVVKEFQPNLIHMQLQYTKVIAPETLLQIKKICPKCVITNWSGDVRSNVPKYFTDIGRVVDYTLLCNTGQLQSLKNDGCKNVKYWQMGIGTEYNFPQHKTEFLYDCCFIGNCYTEFPGFAQRVSFGKAIRNVYGSKCAIFGGGWGSVSNGTIPWAKANEVYNNSKVVISISNFNEIADYFSDRFLMALASGRPVLSWKFPNIENYIQEGYNGYVMNDVEDGMIKLKQLLNKSPQVLNQVGAVGARTVLHQHTFVSRIEELFKLTGIIK